MTEALPSELRQFGIHVSLIEPEFVKSNIVSNGPTRPIADYDGARESAVALPDEGLPTGSRSR
jgi:short-subunit dehydrogenase